MTEPVLFPTDAEFMPLEVFVNRYGDIVLAQEFPRFEGEQYVRLLIRTEAAEELISAIRAAAAEAQKRGAA